jgi:hypothetical protein
MGVLLGVPFPLPTVYCNHGDRREIAGRDLAAQYFTGKILKTNYLAQASGSCYAGAQADHSTNELVRSRSDVTLSLGISQGKSNPTQDAEKALGSKAEGFSSTGLNQKVNLTAN